MENRTQTWLGRIAPEAFVSMYPPGTESRACDEGRNLNNRLPCAMITLVYEPVLVMASSVVGLASKPLPSGRVKATFPDRALISVP